MKEHRPRVGPRRGRVALALAMALAGCATPEASPTAEPTPSRTATPSPTASASPTSTPSPSPTPLPVASGAYLALGDSLAVGVGATRRNEHGYVARLYRSLSRDDAVPRATTLRTLAVSGETTTSMIRNGQLAEAVDAIGRANPGVVLVTLDIGGNDLLHLLRTDECVARPLGGDCLQLLALTLADFEANYGQILDELTGALSEHAPAARLAVMTYFNPFSGTDASFEAASEIALLGIDGAIDCEADDPRAHGMNDIIVCVGGAFGAVTVDVQPAFEGLGLELTHIGSEDIHANDRGYAAIADLFIAALERQ